MSKAITIGIVAGALSLAVLAAGYAVGGRVQTVASAPTLATQPSGQDLAATPERARIEAIVRDYLVTNPEIMIDVQQALDARQREAERFAQRETIRMSASDIFDAAHDGIVGNPEGSVTIVEFFDYNCGYCRRALEDMEALVAADPDLRFVLKEFPILGPDSQRAHVVSMAVRALSPEVYPEFHRTLMSGTRATEEIAIGIATSLGVDEPALRQEMQNPEITEAFGHTYELADQLSITGTPSYVVGDEVVFGALGRDVLAQKVDIARACADDEC